jgi:HEPN domain-containing protein
MIAISALNGTAREYLRAAKLLRTRRSYDASVYLCGYAIEIALKARICRMLKWTTGFPETNAEFQDKGNLKTHDFEALLNFTGLRDKVEQDYVDEWSVVCQWRPEQRYNPAGTKGLAEANDIILSTQKLLRVLL